MSRQLTEKQQKFLDVLFEEARGNPVTAKKLAGYSENNPTSAITSSLQEESTKEPTRLCSMFVMPTFLRLASGISNEPGKQ